MPGRDRTHRRLVESRLPLTAFDKTLQDLALESTPSGWLEAVMDDFDSFLKDHASCEKKASGMALNIASHYPDQPVLVAAMADLAVEELGHYREVIRLLIERGLTPGPDRKDFYIRALNEEIRRGPELYLLDRLLVAAIVERRGSERFGLIAEALPRAEFAGAAQLAAFYRGITASEGRHWRLFLDLAQRHCPGMAIDARLSELMTREGEVMLAQPFEPTLH